ncbi:pro-sigmaK processing inhibitor BofA family protein [Bacillus sonorensis]|uniref:pro-sigmaK processing inhibitor BofA family protein n=1 Tax=Bacillus sonorensis TaxID=119858 RepID=UPI0004967D69|nr:pro-sigmaK processing inhibitor BofA family protein [Bacillus sonorensis]MBG9913665.1 sigma-K factor-processing regulatory protein BofA [Bacillus sonorensis]MCF7615682.1 pro-sigmaK processing inhibitor BofA family protein [Bacillus sonorensis]MCY7859537.1 pro-sigmaK processing inhibitor BofA family protein [Bacillus sonorensis]MCY8036396.1 pro-sigmaK processing inhibitor BofA family protein [Bacillus sonorensis]MCY8090208.1 pro-sigmaK processing inhibitor BofA family protein [Bacillus sonor
MGPVIIIGAIVVLVALLFFSGASFKPLKWTGAIAIRFIVGAVFLFCVNLFGQSMGIHVPINFVTTGVSGLLGVPGVAALIVIKQFIMV